MATQDIFALINSRYNKFTKAEKKVADFILHNRDEVIYMSITDLAEACAVGEASVFRFCKSMELKGYQEFRIILAHSINNDQDDKYLSSVITIEDSTDVLANKILASNIQALTDTFNLFKEEDIQKAVQWLIEAERIHFFGVGSSAITAMDAKTKFMRITSKTEFIMDSHLQNITASLLTQQDVAIVISYSGSTKDMIEVARILKARGTKIISITRFAKSPLTTYSDITLLCGANEGPLQGGSLSAKLSQLYLLDLLYYEYFIQTEDQSIDNKVSTAQSIVEKML